MTIEQDFLPYAVGGTANVLSQSAYAALTSLLQNGLTSGIVPSNELNKILRQPSIIASVIGQLIVNNSGQAAIDDGTTATLLANLSTAISVIARQNPVLTDTGAANAYVVANLAAFTAYPTVSGLTIDVSILNANTGASTLNVDGLGTKPILGLGLQPLQGNELIVKGVATLMYIVASTVNSGNGAWILMECAGGAQQIAPATQSQHAVQLGQLASGLNLTTPAQFDNSTKMATTAAIWQNRAGFDGLLGISANTTLTTSQVGLYIIGLTAGSPFTITLPVTTAAYASVSTRIVNLSSQTITVQTQSGGTIQGPFNTVGGSSFTIPANSTVDLICNNANNYIVTGDGQLAFSSMFANSLTGPGYQKLPGGLIVQFGTWTSSATVGNPVAVTYPIPFPSATLGIATTVSSASTSIVSAWYDTATATGFNGHGNLATLTCNYIAVGK